jgi:hypothetical protein
MKRFTVWLSRFENLRARGKETFMPGSGSSKLRSGSLEHVHLRNEPATVNFLRKLSCYYRPCCIFRQFCS